MREVYVITEVEKTVAVISCHQSEYSLKNCWAPGTHTCYPSSWGGGDGEGHGTSPAWAKAHETPISTNRWVQCLSSQQQ
jgi:hypothetical protein